MPFDRRHFRWHLMVEYLCTVRGLAVADLMDGKVTEGGAWAEMMAWYVALEAQEPEPGLSGRAL